MPFVCGVVKSCETIDKKLKKVIVDVDVTIVTNAPNVRTGTRTVVALIGTELDDETKITERKISGVTSQGMLCDSKMLKWSGGAEGICVQVPETFKAGDPAPSTKPRMDGEETPVAPEKSDKELKAEAKAAKKAAAAAKKEARKAKKAGDVATKTETEEITTVLENVEKVSINDVP